MLQTLTNQPNVQSHWKWTNKRNVLQKCCWVERSVATLGGDLCHTLMSQSVTVCRCSRTLRRLCLGFVYDLLLSSWTGLVSTFFLAKCNPELASQRHSRVGHSFPLLRKEKCLLVHNHSTLVNSGVPNCGRNKTVQTVLQIHINPTWDNQQPGVPLQQVSALLLCCPKSFQVWRCCSVRLNLTSLCKVVGEAFQAATNDYCPRCPGILDWKSVDSITCSGIAGTISNVKQTQQDGDRCLILSIQQPRTDRFLCYASNSSTSPYWSRWKRECLIFLPANLMSN